MHNLFHIYEKCLCRFREITSSMSMISNCDAILVKSYFVLQKTNVSNINEIVKMYTLTSLILLLQCYIVPSVNIKLKLRLFRHILMKSTKPRHLLCANTSQLQRFALDAGRGSLWRVFPWHPCDSPLILDQIEVYDVIWWYMVGERRGGGLKFWYSMI